MREFIYDFNLNFQKKHVVFIKNDILGTKKFEQGI